MRLRRIKSAAGGKVCGFTLIELLVIIAVIGILAAILLPVLSRAKAAAHSTACKSNLRQQSIGLRIYLEDCEQYPFWQTWTAEGRLAWDTSVLEKSGGQADIFLCPGMKNRLLWKGPFNPSYGYNLCGTAGQFDVALGLGGVTGPLPEGTTTYRPMREAEILVPSEMIAIGDYREDQFQQGEIAFHNKYNYIANRHNGGGNVAFCDGHVEYDKQWKWMEASDAARRRWNRDNEPHPETW
jgi:prepilin-type processing-associated H-X9-DG protein/prepilin-type N-terminal cleavage/methylation domain-containing protein